MKQYLDCLHHVLENGEARQDRTGTGTIGVFGYQMRFNLQEGFPAVTTKRLAWNAMKSELLWFLEGSDDERRLAAILFPDLAEWELENKRTIWTDNAEAQGMRLGYTDGKLGPIYGRIWRKKYVHTMDVINVNPRYDTSTYRRPVYKRHDISHDDDLCGMVFTNKANAEFIVVSHDSVRNRNSHYLIQFVNSGYTTVASRPNIRRGMVSDPYTNTVYDVACFGEISSSEKTNKLYTTKYNMWHNMIARCYNNQHPSYGHYGENGITVCERWLVFSNFLKDISSIAGYEYWSENPGKYDIDKDYYSATVYSPNTCIFLESWYNKLLSSNYVPIEVVGVGKFLSVSHFLDVIGSTSDSWYVLKRFKQGKPWNGYTATLLNISSLRYNRVIDQVTQLIDGIKNDPFGRRHILSAWDTELLNKQALPPCHCFVQFYVSASGKLSCQLYQRSADVFLGVPFNIASYALLTHMIAQVCGLQVGDFIWTGGDVHIYSNHVDQVTEQLKRDPLPLPTLIIDTLIFDIDKFSMNSFELKDYNPMPTIRAPMAI